MDERTPASSESNNSRTLRVEVSACIDPACAGEVYEIEWYENINWATAVYRCAKCGREFTVKVEA